MNLNNITTALKTGITIYQYEQWQNTGSVNLMQKESHMLSKVWLKTNIHNPDSLDKPFIQLSATFDKEATNGEPPYPVIEINRKGLANFLNDDQGYESGISMYGHYIACKSLDISSEEEYMNQLTDIKLICNEL